MFDRFQVVVDRNLTYGDVDAVIGDRRYALDLLVTF